MLQENDIIIKKLKVKKKNDFRNSFQSLVILMKSFSIFLDFCWPTNSLNFLKEIFQQERFLPYRKIFLRVGDRVCGSDWCPRDFVLSKFEAIFSKSILRDKGRD